MKTFLMRVLALSVVLAMAACTTLQPLAVDASQLSHSLKPGDQVEVTTTRGQQLQLKIENVDATGLQGSGQRVAFSDIQSISRKQVDTKRTVLVVLGVVAAGAIAAGAGGGGGGGSGY
jgi:hypothetical protein